MKKNVLCFHNVLNCIIEKFFFLYISELAYKMLFNVGEEKVRLIRVLLIEKILF